jgi:nitrite reductase/ring-hydroxylating ferredoxin subunit/Fe-S cluster biogenesis protein NfuA
MPAPPSPNGAASPPSHAESRTDIETLAHDIDDAMAALADLDDTARDTAVQLKDALEALHRDVLVAIVRRLKADPRGKELLFELVDDPAVRMALSLHDIIKPDLSTRVAQVIEEVRPYAKSHGGDVELVRVEDKTVYVRLHGSCNGCSMSAATLQNGVMEVLEERVPEIETIEVVSEPGPAMIPLDEVGMLDQSGWIEGPEAADVEPGRLYRIDGDDYDILLVRLDDQLHAYRNACAHQGRPLDGGQLDDDVLVCPWHGFRFEVTSGECMTVPQAQLEPFPLRVDDGTIWIRPSHD